MSRANFAFYMISVPLVFSFAIVNPARASLTLEFSLSSSVNKLEVLPGNSLSIPLYLRQHSSEASHPNFVATHGLNIFGVAGSLVGSGVSLVNNSLTFATPFVDQGFLNPSSLTATSFVMNGFDPRLGSPGAIGEAIFLGSITVRGDTPGAIAMLTLGDPDANLDDFAASPNFGSFDANVFSSSASVTISVVPEAGSIVLAIAGLISVALFMSPFIQRFSRKLGEDDASSDNLKWMIRLV